MSGTRRDVGMRGGGLLQRLLHRPAGGVVDMDDAAMAVPALAGEVPGAAVLAAVERHAELGEPVDRRRRAARRRTRPSARSLSPAPAIIVSSIWLSNVSPGSSTAAIPPCAQAVEPVGEPALGEHRHLEARREVERRASAPPRRSRSTIDVDNALLSHPSPARAGEVEEDVLQIGLAGRDVDDAEPLALQRGEHLAGIDPVLAIGDRQRPLAVQLDLVEAVVVGRRGEIAVDRRPRPLSPAPCRPASGSSRWRSAGRG